MKKIAFISGMVFVSFLLISQGLYAQRFYRCDPEIEDDYYDLNLTQEQMEKIDKLDMELQEELSPLFSKLRSNHVLLDELEAQRSPDPTTINSVWDVILGLEEDIRNKEILHEKKIRDLLTVDQKAIFDSYYSDDTNPYGCGGLGRGYIRRGPRGFSGGYYRYGCYGYNVRGGRDYFRRGAGRLGRGYYGYGRGASRGYGMNRRNFRPGAGRLYGHNYFRYYPRIRYGRGPCGAGLGKWRRWDYDKVRWNREE
jgi:hypothetical protein